MRIWDVHPGYLNRQSLLGEHRELHGIVSIVANGKKGYANHPETVRWAAHGWAIRQRHRLLVAEMSLRGFTDRSPVFSSEESGDWPPTFIDNPLRQFQLLATKYKDREPGRIPLPVNAQQLWRQHKYSVLARDVSCYRDLGRKVAAMKHLHDFAALAMRLTGLLREAPTNGGMRNALQHMWGYVAGPSGDNGVVEDWSSRRLLAEIQQRALAHNESYLLSSTALSELAAWLPHDPD